MIMNQSIIGGGTRQGPAGGNLFLVAGRVFHRRPPEYTGLRFPDNLDTNGLIESKKFGLTLESNLAS
jgi:hypothetical protein